MLLFRLGGYRGVAQLGALTLCRRGRRLPTDPSMLLGVRTDPGHTDVDGDPGGSWLDHAHSSRAEIHQATGIVLAQLELTADQALARMRGYAFAEQRLLIDIAHDVVSRRLQFTKEMR